ncbi:MAG: thiamine diphosphokinase [Clostridia bacterium]|nr:thiamine diphosphokinase [Clostridia bacterium]
MKKCVIFGAGEYDESLPVREEGDFFIAADGGLEAMLSRGFTPDLILGDFDSLKTSLPEGIPTVTLPVEKDVTDMDAAVAQGLKRGYKLFLLYGGAGGRPDHTFANYSLLARLSMNGCSARLYGAGFTVSAITDGCITLRGEKNKTVSVFSWTDVSEGVSIRGMKYNLENETLTSSFALGVSNAFEREEGEISVNKGTLLIMREL